MFPFFTIFLLFLAWFTYNKIRIEKKEKAREEAFWKKEEEANATRKKDISLLPYVRIPMDRLPFQIRPKDETLVACEERVRALSQEKILNLTGKTNTDLKLLYGAPNLTFLSQCDLNFTELVRTMQTWGARLYELLLIEEAACVLSHSIQWGSDIKASYLLLARIYREQGNLSALEELRRPTGISGGLLCLLSIPDSFPHCLLPLLFHLPLLGKILPYSLSWILIMERLSCM